MNSRTRIFRSDLDRCVDLARGRTADEKGNSEILTFHFLGDMNHFIEGWSDQPGKADRIDFVLLRLLENLLAGHHYAEVDHLEVVAGENY